MSLGCWCPFLLCLLWLVAVEGSCWPLGAVVGSVHCLKPVVVGVVGLVLAGFWNVGVAVVPPPPKTPAPCAGWVWSVPFGCVRGKTETGRHRRGSCSFIVLFKDLLFHYSFV